ncbi:hypothetical protein JCM10449v2_005176 [Rhodotorula kratochvilovae]
MAHHTIAVIGATGNQGSGVVSALLAQTDFSVRALSSNPSSAKAQAFLDQHKDAAHLGRLTIVKGDFDDPAELHEALKNVYGVFASMPMQTGREGDEAVEVRQGKALVDACKAIDVEHFVYSSLPSIAKLSGGKYTHVTHFESKATVAEYAQKQLRNVTLVVPGMFYSNLSNPSFAQREADFSVRFCFPLKPTTPIQWVDDRYDVGNFVAAIFRAGPASTRGKTYPIHAPPITPAAFAETYHALTGETARFDPLEKDEAVAMMVGDKDGDEGREFTEMFAFTDEPRPKGTGAFEAAFKVDSSAEDLGVHASDLQMFLERTGYRVGRKM